MEASFHRFRFISRFVCKTQHFQLPKDRSRAFQYVNKEIGTCKCTLKSSWLSKLWVYRTSHIMDSLFTLFSLHTYKQNINSPASQQAASRQAAQTSAAASAAPSKVSIQLRASMVLTLFRTQASLRQRQSSFPVQRGAMEAAGFGARRRWMTSGVGWSCPSFCAGRRILLRRSKPGRL